MKTVATVLQELKTGFMGALSDANFANCVVIYFILYVMVIILPFYFYLLSKGDSVLTSKEYAYVYFFMYVMGLFLCTVLFLNSEKNKKLYMGIFAVIFTVMAVMIYYYTNSTKFAADYAVYFSIIFQVVVVLIVVVALALTYKIFENNFRNQTGIVGFLIDLVFYLPCLFIEFIQAIGKEFKSTPNIVFVLFVFEILLLLAYYYIPKAIQSAIFKNEIRIVPDAMFLQQSSQVAAANDLMPIVTKDPTTYLDVKTPRANYTISMWVYLNQQTHNMTDQATCNIFSYGSNNNYKPKISYYNSVDQLNTKNIYRITFAGAETAEENQTQQNTAYNIELTAQKWNHIVLNYNSSYVDLYINGILERTFPFAMNSPKYYPTDIITVGDKNGLDGAICNVCYYTTPLTDYQIVNTYNLLANKNPPIP